MLFGTRKGQRLKKQEMKKELKIMVSCHRFRESFSYLGGWVQEDDSLNLCVMCTMAFESIHDAQLISWEFSVSLSDILLVERLFLID